MKNLVEIIDGDVIPLSEHKASRIPEYGTRYLVGDELFALIQDYARRNANDVAWSQRVPQDVAEHPEARADARKLAEERASLVARVRTEGRPWRTMLGISEIAEEAGAKRQTVAQWYRRGKLPQPAEVLAAGPVWTREAIQEWIDAAKAPAKIPGERRYKGFDIYRDDLGRYCVRDPKSPYSREADHRVFGSLKDAKAGINACLANGFWY